MTNIGLRISLRLNHDFNRREGISGYIFGSPEAPNVITAALKCRQDNDFFKVLAIPLQQIGPKEFIRDPRERPTFLPIATSDRYVEQEIFIRNDNESTQDFLPPNTHLAFVFRELPPAIEIVGVYPPEFWNPKDMILQGLKPAPHEQQPWYACLRLNVRKAEEESRTEEMLLILGVDFRPKWKEESEQGDPEGRHLENGTLVVTWCKLLESKPYKPLAQVQEEFGHSWGVLLAGFCEFQGVRVDLNGSFGAAKRSFSHVLGEIMCVVDITVVGEEKKSSGFVWPANFKSMLPLRKRH
jgi:hypothetical protein